MRYYITIPIVALIAIFQATISPEFRLFGVNPDLTLVVTIVWVLIRGEQEGVLAALIGGAAVAALSGGPRLLIIASFVACNLLVGYAYRHLPRMAGIIPYLAIVVSTLLVKIVLIFWLSTTTDLLYLRGLVVQKVLPALLYNLVLMVVIYNLADRIDRRLGPPTVEWQ
ncbi:MAG: hypothetical protein GXY52_10190 [Chloroflexi bacterium]|nr:hypothetical protein [Chloroflexota bacterium]